MSRGLRTLALVAAVMLPGCGNISNSVFDEDADFLAAFPGASTLALDAPPGADATDPPALLGLTVSVGTVLDATFAALLDGFDTVRSGPPASREDDARTWGAYDWNGTDLTAAMQLTGGTRYDWSLAADGETFATGSHYAGKTVATGDGALHWDETTRAAAAGQPAEGELDITYDSREGVDLLVAASRWTTDPALTDPVDATFAYTLATAAGDFQFRSPVTGPAGEDWSATARTRWIENVGGRTDAALTGPDLDGDEIWTECWDAAGVLTWETDTQALVENVGGEGGDALCALHGQALADRI